MRKEFVIPRVEVSDSQSAMIESDLHAIVEYLEAKKSDPLCGLTCDEWATLRHIKNLLYVGNNGGS